CGGKCPPGVGQVGQKRVVGEKRRVKKQGAGRDWRGGIDEESNVGVVVDVGAGEDEVPDQGFGVVRRLLWQRRRGRHQSRGGGGGCPWRSYHGRIVGSCAGGSME